MAKEEISLLPKHGLEGTIIGKFFDWVFSVGCYIVVFTELIVIGAFLSRFWLDRRNTDLSEKIRQQRAILESNQAFESEFRLFQSKLQVVARELEQGNNLLLPFQVVVKSLPSDVYLKNFSWSEKNQQVTLGTAIFSEVGLSMFIDNLLSQPEISSVNIGTIKKDQDTVGTEIRITVNFNKEKTNGS
jgi:hypothetical protein